MSAEIKPIFGMERVKLAEVVPLDTPFTLFIFPTTFCNFKCKYCGHSLGLEKMKEQYGFVPQMMDMDTFQRVIDQASRFPKKLKMVSLTGQGEPLLNPDLPKMIAATKQSGIADRIEMISNASLLTNEKSLALVDAGLDILRISLQGLSREKYNETCGVDLDFERFMNNIRFFYQHKKQCKLFVKVLDATLDQGDDQRFYKMFGDICDRMYIEQCKPVYDGVRYDHVTTTTDRYGRQHEQRDVCPLCFFMLSVFPDGDVEPCDTIYKPVVLGNVHQETLTDIWSGQKLRDFQILHLEKNRCLNAKCSVCCAPNDVSQPEDVLDAAAEYLLSKFRGV